MRILQLAIYLGLVFLFTTQSVAQTNYQPGFLVNNNGDTVKGFIDHKEWTRNPRKIEFKGSPGDANSVPFSAAQIIFFRVEEDEFLSYAGPVSTDQNSIKLADVPEYTEVEDTIFLNVITRGEIFQLFQYRDKLKLRFFFSIKGSKPVELIYRFFMVERDGRSGVNDVRKYRTQLMTAASQTNTLNPHLKTLIQKSSYTLSQLTAIADQINPRTTKAATANKSAAVFYAGLGYNYATSLYVPNSAGTSASSSFPYIALGFDYFGNAQVRKLSFRGEISWTYAQFGLLNQGTTSVSLQPVYNFYNKRNFKVYLSPGIRFNVSTYTNVPIGVDYNYIPVYLSLILQAGVLIDQRYEIVAAYLPQLGNVTLTDTQSVTFNVLRLGVNYHFSLKRRL